jgi:Nucleolar protein,Nop52
MCRVQLYTIYTRRTLVVGCPTPLTSPHAHWSQSPEDTRVPSSLAYHLADIYLEELDKVSNLPSVRSLT